MTSMTFPQGYRMMFQYLNGIWAQTHDGTLGGLLGEMSLLPDGTPADPAYTEDWNDALGLASQRCGSGKPASELAYHGTICFLEGWLGVGWGLSAAEVHTQRLWTDLSDEYQAPICHVVRDMIEGKRMDLWTEAVRAVRESTDDPYLRFVDET